MIRKIIHISFAILLLITSAGFTVSKHYCNNHLREIVIDKPAVKCCPNEDGCCKTETLLIQLDDEAVSQTAVAIPTNIVLQIQPLIAINLLISLVNEPAKTEFLKYISPPPLKIQSFLSLLETYRL